MANQFTLSECLSYAAMWMHRAFMLPPNGGLSEECARRASVWFIRADIARENGNYEYNGSARGLYINL